MTSKPDVAFAEDRATSAISGLDTLALFPAQRARFLRKTASRTWPKLLAIAIVLGAWFVFYKINWRGDTADHLIQSPGYVLGDLWDMLKTGEIWKGIWITISTAAYGYGVAVLIGSIVGALVSRIPPLRAGVGSIISGLQTMPSIAWFPFAIILFGMSQSAIIFVMVLGAGPSIANGLVTGVDYTPPLLLRAGRTMGLRRIALYRHLILPASLPAYVAGLRQGWAFSWRSLMAGELLVTIAGQAPSLGVLLSTNQANLDLSGAIAVMIIILTIGIVVDMLFSKLDVTIRRRRGLLTDGQTI